jgi:hypothetical protein
MRAFGFLGTLTVAAIAMYLYSLQVKVLEPSAASGNHEEVANIAGVKTDLLTIASAERGYQATEGKLASLDELISGNYLIIKRDRPPYIYDIEISGGSFRVTATRTEKGSPAQLWVTENMQVQSSD